MNNDLAWHRKTGFPFRNLITKLDHFLIGLCNHNYQDPEYDRALHRYFWTYHNLVDLMVRVAVNEVEDSFSTFIACCKDIQSCIHSLEI